MGPLHRGISGIDHIAIPASDLALGERFYADLLGGDRVRRQGAAFTRTKSRGETGDTPAIRLAAGPMLELTNASTPKVALTVRPEDLLAFRAILVAHGIPVDGPRQSGAGGQTSLYFFDPFGNRLEIVTLGFRGDAVTGEPDFTGLRWSSDP